MTIRILPLLVLLFIACKKEKPAVSDEQENGSENTTEINAPTITPIQHATFVLEWGEEVVYVDPTGGKESFADKPDPTLILITDIHGDHFDVETLSQLSPDAHMVAPEAVYTKMPKDLQNRTKLVANGQNIVFHGFNITAIPMYNMSQDRLNFHVKGRGNGYVVSKDDYKVYISGDTEDIPEMRNLKEIDLAFICMNLPYTMTPESAADAALEFKPNKVIPYHYRGRKDGASYYHNVEGFKSIVNSGNPEIKVELLDWYPNR